MYQLLEYYCCINYLNRNGKGVDTDAIYSQKLKPLTLQTTDLVGSRGTLNNNKCRHEYMLAKTWS